MLNSNSFLLYISNILNRRDAEISISILVLEINTFFFRKDKFGISLKVIICTFLIRVLWGVTPGPTGQIKGK